MHGMLHLLVVCDFHESGCILGQHYIWLPTAGLRVSQAQIIIRVERLNRRELLLASQKSHIALLFYERRVQRDSFGVPITALFV
ncbi:hypothetical protein ACE6H2_014838 [Prunus campanulata]